MKIGVMFGSPETTPGGRALKFYASVRIDIRRIAQIKKGQDVVGSRTKVKIVKNKLAPPFRECELDVLYGEGISYEGDLIDIAAAMEIVEKSGMWYSFEGERIGQGRDATRQFLKEHPEVSERIDAKVREKAGLKPKAPRPAEPAAEEKGGRKK
jgi:recombination protein RecA